MTETNPTDKELPPQARYWWRFLAHYCTDLPQRYIVLLNYHWPEAQWDDFRAHMGKVATGEVQIKGIGKVARKHIQEFMDTKGWRWDYGEG